MGPQSDRLEVCARNKAEISTETKFVSAVENYSLTDSMNICYIVETIMNFQSSISICFLCAFPSSIGKEFFGRGKC